MLEGEGKNQRVDIICVGGKGCVCVGGGGGSFLFGVPGDYLDMHFDKNVRHQTVRACE